MKTAAFLSVSAACVMAGSLIAHGQTEPLLARPGYYRGTFTMSSPSFDGKKAPVKSSFPVAARVAESLTTPGKQHATIRFRPTPDVNAPLKDLVFRWESVFSSYVMFQGDGLGTGGSSTLSELQETRNKLVITTKFAQTSSEGISNFADVRVTLVRVGD